jgi:hypothetical protein
MAPLLRTLLGNGTKDRELTDEMRAVLQRSGRNAPRETP